MPGRFEAWCLQNEWMMLLGWMMSRERPNSANYEEPLYSEQQLFSLWRPPWCCARLRLEAPVPILVDNDPSWLRNCLVRVSGDLEAGGDLNALATYKSDRGPGSCLRPNKICRRPEPAGDLNLSAT